ncbi:hypothetical protein CFAM422_007800 [Trichoderma lentiforme]|uniref:Uncharacterized protein n=1 Tax=Trichoderma lentiforme TaxID=1567552 RepID=A0A9P4XCI7_9HYPO|nr:hypothetical protein CFAM422_007800 [Trichoderma lentiforme]
MLPDLGETGISEAGAGDGTSSQHLLEIFDVGRGVAAHEVAERTEQCHECQACQQTADCELEQTGRGPGTKRRGQMLASKN